MSTLNPSQLAFAAEARFARRSFLRRAGVVGLGVAAAGLTVGSANSAFAAGASTPEEEQQMEQNQDTVAEIFTAALIAEDLATTFYYHGLVGKVIEDVNLAGPGGSATNVTAAGNFGNVAYIRAALSEEIAHANLFRSLLGIPDAQSDPVQTFYFPEGTFKTLGAFTSLLNALENAFIGAYLNAIQEFARKSADLRAGNGGEAKYTAKELDYFAKVAAAIMGVEAEHRVLGRVISNSNPANNLMYQQTDGINAVYNGPNSAVAALTPFLTPSTGPGRSLGVALSHEASVSEPVAGPLPAF